MKVVSLNHEAGDVEIFHITDEFYNWCVEHEVSNDDTEEPETFSEFMTEFFRQLGYDNPEFKPYMVAQDDEPIRIMEAYPDNHIEHVL